MTRQEAMVAAFWELVDAGGSRHDRKSSNKPELDLEPELEWEEPTEAEHEAWRADCERANADQVSQSVEAAAARVDLDELGDDYTAFSDDDFDKLLLAAESGNVKPRTHVEERKIRALVGRVSRRTSREVVADIRARTMMVRQTAICRREPRRQVAGRRSTRRVCRARAPARPRSADDPELDASPHGALPGGGVPWLCATRASWGLSGAASHTHPAEVRQLPLEPAHSPGWPPAEVLLQGQVTP